MNDYIGRICPFCKKDIQEGEASAVCPDCGTAHHEDCWKLVGGCAAPHCSGSAPNAAPAIAECNCSAHKAKPAKKKALCILLPAALCVLILAAVASWFLYVLPNTKYEQATQLYAAGNYADALLRFQELGSYHDSPDQVLNCERQILQAVYDEAISLYEENQHAEAIELLLTLDGFSDSTAKITQIQEAYLSSAQVLYGRLFRGYSHDRTLSSYVHATLTLADLYDASDATAMDHLYSGSPYRVSYSWSQYSNGDATIISQESAQAFKELLGWTEENMSTLETGMLALQNPPEEYKDLLSSLTALLQAYTGYHSFVSSQPQSDDTSYEAARSSCEKVVEDALTAISAQYPQIAEKVAE